MFSEQPLDSRLHPFAAVWRSDSAGGQLIVPDGSADIFVDLDSEERWVVGPMSRPLRTELGRPRRLLGVRLRPWAAHSVLGPPELIDERLGLGDINPRLAELLRRAPPGALAAALERATERVAFDVRVRRIVEHLQSRPEGPGGIAALASAAGLTDRQLERLFRRHVGLSPKQLHRVLRLSRALSSAEPSLVERAVGAGYADHAHFCRDARALTGLSPRRLLTALGRSDSSKTG